MMKKPYALSAHDVFLEEYASYYENTAEPNSDCFIPEFDEKDIGYRIHLFDNRFVQYQTYLKQAEHILKNEDASNAQAEVMREYLDLIGDTYQQLYDFYADSLQKKTKNMSLKEKQAFYRDIYTLLAPKNELDRAVPDHIEANRLILLLTKSKRKNAEEMRIFNTECLSYLPIQILKISDKERNPYGVYKMNFEDLKDTPYQKKIMHWMQQKGNNICDVLRYKAACHELMHGRGTYDEWKAEIFAYLKVLQKFKEPALLETGFLGRATAAFDRIETMRYQINEGTSSMDSSWNYQMIPMLSYLREKAPKYVESKEFLSKSDAELIEMTKQIAHDSHLRYSDESEQIFLNALKGISHENLIQILEEKSNDSQFPPIVQDSMSFFNSYRPEGKKYKNVSEFLADKKFLLDAEYQCLSSSERHKKPFQEQKGNNGEFKLSNNQMKRYQDICIQIMNKNPNASPLDLANGIIIANLNAVTDIENKYNADGTLFFNEQQCLSDAKIIKALNDECEHVGKIVKILMNKMRIQSQNKTNIAPNENAENKARAKTTGLSPIKKMYSESLKNR